MLNSRLFARLLLATGLGLGSAALVAAQVPAAAIPSQDASSRTGANGMTQPLASESGSVEAPAILIGPGDMLAVQVFDTPELSAAVRVNQDGDADLPVLGPVHLAGLTTAQAGTTIANAYQTQGLVLSPTVTVSETEFASQGATVLGEVRAPGVYPTLGSRRLLDMLSLAGGVSNASGRLVSIVHRGDPQHPAQIALQPTPASLHAQKNPVIQPGDTVIVAKSGVIYVLGDVQRPGGILVDNNERLSIIEALSLAGGMNKTAALSKTELIRKLPAGREQVDLDLKHILKGKQADVLVSDGDILYVPSSFGKTLLYRGIEAAFGLSTSAAVYLR